MRCELHDEITTRFVKCDQATRHCETCGDRTRNAALFNRLPGPACGIVIGSFRWPELVDLQLRVIRRTCGAVPVLVSNDLPAGHADLVAVCRRHRGVTLATNPERIGHTGGDVAAFHRGIKWGAERGLQCVAKLSQRFIVDRPRWLQDSSADLLASGLSMACMRVIGNQIFDLRTEAALLDVRQWNHPEILARLEPRQYWSDLPTGLTAERIVFRVLQDFTGGIYWPWSTLIGEERFIRDFDDVLWHNNTPEEEYRAFAASHGVTLPDDFHVSGWEAEMQNGTYQFG